MTRAILAVLLCATAAGADTRREWTAGTETSHVELSAPTDPACAALVTFEDQYVHTATEDFTLSWQDVTVDFRIVFDVTAGPETLYIAPPVGYYALPDTLRPGEMNTGEAHICPLGVAS